jgi:hypothetical protein
MVEDLYAEKLNWFKQNERPEVVLLLADNTDLVKIVVAWTRLDTKRVDKLSALPHDSDGEIWEWLWKNTVYSLKELKEKISTSLSTIALENRIKPLIGNRIIYPDGTVNSFVERYLREKVVKLFKEKSRRTSKKN